MPNFVGEFSQGASITPSANEIVAAKRAAVISSMISSLRSRSFTASGLLAMARSQRVGANGSRVRADPLVRSGDGKRPL